jgi:RNA polymerase sigma-70 factor, ECF subfamily
VEVVRGFSGRAVMALKGSTPMTEFEGPKTSPELRPDEFMQLFAAHQRRILAYIHVLLPNRSDAEDVAQEVSRTLWEKFDEFRSGTNFGAWALRITQLKVFEHRRSQRRQRLVFTDQTLEKVAYDAAEMWCEIDRQQRALEECLKELSPRHQQLLQARYGSNGTLVAAAKTISRSVVTARAMLRRIHEAVHDCIRRKLEAEIVP